MVNTAKPDTTTAASTAEASARNRSLLLVAGSGRSGTSTFSGILQRLGFHVPQPEVPADETNPRGFAESQWVVDFHARLLKRARLQTADARPSAWAETARVSLDEQVRLELGSWIGGQFTEADHLLVKDPRLSWFLPLWRRCAEDIGVLPRFATVLRHPAAVIQSKRRSYGTYPNDASRTAGWLNQVLFTERATREAPRVFLRYEDLLDDWTLAIDRVGKVLDLPFVADASTTSIVSVAQFLDPSLSRSQAGWDALAISQALREQANTVWNLLSRLPEEEDDPELQARLDEVRAGYIAFYQEAEAVAESSIWAAAKPRKTHPPGRLASAGLVRIVPRTVRRRVPLRLRRALIRALKTSG